MGSEVINVRTGEVRVKAQRCPTCIFRPGNLMSLKQGRVRQMVDAARESQGHITCHSTLGAGSDGAICRGFADGPAVHHGCRALMVGTLLNSINEV